MSDRVLLLDFFPLSSYLNSIGPCACPRGDEIGWPHRTQTTRHATRTSTRPLPFSTSTPCPYRTEADIPNHSLIRSSTFIRGYACSPSTRLYRAVRKSGGRAANPATVIRPSRSNRVTRPRLDSDQGLFGRRGVQRPA